LIEKNKKIPREEWQECPMPGCNNNGGYPRHAYGCDGSCVNCPEEEQCEFCWTNPKSVFNQMRIGNDYDEWVGSLNCDCEV
jgi:hypothetical protein